MNLELDRFKDRDGGGEVAGVCVDIRYAMVDLAKDQDLRVWTGRLSCSAEKLLAAVESVGPRVEHVSEYLRAGW